MRLKILMMHAVGVVCVPNRVGVVSLKVSSFHFFRFFFKILFPKLFWFSFIFLWDELICILYVVLECLKSKEGSHLKYLDVM